MNAKGVLREGKNLSFLGGRGMGGGGLEYDFQTVVLYI
jgi:hypothetical protein